MSTSDEVVFTEHVKHLGAGTREMPDAVRKKLAARLKRMIQRRGLAKAAAATFGYSGKFLGDDEVFDELLNDAYCHPFYGVGYNAGRQLVFLQKQVEAGNVVDPLIQRELANYVHDLHRQAFPSDAGVYKNVLAAAKSLINAIEYEVMVIGPTERKLTLASLIGMAGDAKSSVDIAAIERAIRNADGWHDTLGCVRRLSKKATCGVATGTLAMMQQGTRPLLLQFLKEVVSDLAYDPAETADMTSTANFPDEDERNPEFVRTILDEDRYEVRQAKVDEFVHEGLRAIESLSCNTITIEKLLEILHCYAEKCRRASPDEFISQEQVRQDVGLKRQTMSDYMAKLRVALEKIQS